MHWDKHASLSGSFGKRNRFCSFIEICDSYGCLGGEEGRRGEFENQQKKLIEVCDCSSEQQGALCVNLEKGGRGFGFNNPAGMKEEEEEEGYYQVSSAFMHWFGAGWVREKQKTGRGRVREQSGSFCRGGCFGTMTLVSSNALLRRVFVGWFVGEGWERTI